MLSEEWTPESDLVFGLFGFCPSAHRAAAGQMKMTRRGHYSLPSSHTDSLLHSSVCVC